ncbi:MAG: multiple sugar transport system substrate-binding protein [Parcubacteria group bacterium Gr01-1014_33]|nr:MAG: multiple sugar transport system substrate-binding protein [Parcubacteria group bacterium Gr01-1014_33]
MSRPLLIIIAIIGLALILSVILFMFGLRPNTNAPVTLEFWGVGQDEVFWRDTFFRFRAAFPNVTVNYRGFDEKSYEATLINRLAEGKGPDVFFLKNSWILTHKDKVFPLPQDFLTFTASDFQNTFTDGVAEELILPDGKIVGLPLAIDTPILFYNKDIFNSAGIAALPQTWDDVVRISQKLTKISPAGDVIKSGIALGGFQNVAHAFEIVSSLLLQAGDQIVKRDASDVILGARAIDAFSFYTSFADPGSKNFSLPRQAENSLDAFTEEKAAMAIGFAQDIQTIREKNPHISFGVLPFPQQNGALRPAVYQRYFFPTVSRMSHYQGTAWQFVHFLASQSEARTFVEKTGRAPVRRDLLAQTPGVREQEILHAQSLIARGWTVPDENIAARLFGDTVNSILSKSASPKEAVARLREQMRLLLP